MSRSNRPLTLLFEDERQDQNVGMA